MGRERSGERGFEDAMRKKGKRQETEEDCVRVCSVDRITEQVGHSNIP